MACRASRGALYRGGVAYRQRQLLKFRHSGESGNPGLLGRCRGESRQLPSTVNAQKSVLAVRRFLYQDSNGSLRIDSGRSRGIASHPRFGTSAKPDIQSRL